MSCCDCVFKSTYQDMGGSTDVCSLRRDLSSAIYACSHSEGCQYRFLLYEAKEIVKARAGGLPVDKPIAKPRELSGDPEKDFFDAMKVVAENANRVAGSLRQIFEDFAKAIEEAKK